MVDETRGNDRDARRDRPDEPSAGWLEESPGQPLESLVERMRESREDAAANGRVEDGVILDQLDVVEERLLAFGRALGGDVDDVGDLPFTEEAAGTACRNRCTSGTTANCSTRSPAGSSRASTSV